MLKRTSPSGKEPIYSCAFGAQCNPVLTAIPRSARIRPNSSEVNPFALHEIILFDLSIGVSISRNENVFKSEDNRS